MFTYVSSLRAIWSFYSDVDDDCDDMVYITTYASHMEKIGDMDMHNYLVQLV